MKRLCLLALLCGCAHRQTQPIVIPPPEDQEVAQARAARRAERRARIGAAAKAFSDSMPARTSCTSYVHGNTVDTDCETR